MKAIVFVVLLLVALTVFVSAHQDQEALESAVFKIIFDDLDEQEQQQFLSDELNEFKIKLPKIDLPKIKIPKELKCASCSACVLLANPLAAAACKIACDKLVREKNNCDSEETNSDSEFKITIPKIKIPTEVKCAACEACSLISNPFAAMACKFGCDKLVREKNNCDSIQTNADEEFLKTAFDADFIFKIIFPQYEKEADSEFRIRLPEIPNELKCAACSKCAQLSNPLGSFACRVACDRFVGQCDATTENTVQSETEIKIRLPKIKLPKIKIPKELKCASCDACALLGNPLASMACKVACDKLVREKNSCDAVPTTSSEDATLSSDAEELAFRIIFSELEDEEQLADEGTEFKIKLPKIKLPKINIPSEVKCAACEGCALLSNPFAAMACKYGCDKLIREKNNCDAQTSSDEPLSSLEVSPSPCQGCQKGCQAIQNSTARKACLNGCATWACQVKPQPKPLPVDVCDRCRTVCNSMSNDKTKESCLRGCNTWVCTASNADSEFRG